MKLFFENPVFEPGKINITVRKGSEWFDYITTYDPAEVEVYDLEENFYGRAGEFKVSLYSSVYDIAVDLLRHEHDPNCRTQRGLDKVLKYIYGEDYSKDTITVVQFKFYSK